MLSKTPALKGLTLKDHPAVQEIFPTKRDREVVFLVDCSFPWKPKRKFTSATMSAEQRKGLTLEQIDLINNLAAIKGVISVELTTAKIVVRCECFAGVDYGRVKRLIKSLVCESQVYSTARAA